MVQYRDFAFNPQEPTTLTLKGQVSIHRINTEFESHLHYL